MASSFSFTINDQFDSFVLSGNFSSDFRSIVNGTVRGRVDCVTSVRDANGTWSGTRTGS